MFLFLGKKSVLKRAALAALVLVFSAGLMFVSCKSDPDDDLLPPPPGPNVPSALQGAWMSGWGEEYIITATEFTNKYTGDVSYAGTIVNHRIYESGAGYLTIKYTENPYEPALIGKYNVIFYENLESLKISLIAAYDGIGKGTQGAAETEYTVENDYFDMAHSSSLHKTSYIQSRPNSLQGAWYGGFGDTETFIITDKVIIYQLGYPILIGEIVNIPKDETTIGYITFKILENYWGDALVGKFSVLYWESNTGTDAYITIAADVSPGDIGEDTKEKAEDEYIDDEDYFWWLDEDDIFYKG